MRKITFVFGYSDTYYDKPFNKPMEPSTISVVVPDVLSNEVVLDNIKKIHNLIESQRIDENCNVVEEGEEGYDWYGKIGYNARTLMTIVCSLVDWFQIPTDDTFFVDFDTLGD